MKIDTANPRLTFSQIKISIDSSQDIYAKSIQYGDSMERAEVEGNGQIAAGVTAGMYKTDEAQIELYAEEFAALLEQFGDGFYSKPFTVTVSYVYDDGKGVLKSDVLKACRWTKRAANQTGADALTRTLSYKPHWIEWNGKRPLSKMPAGTQ